MIEAAVLTACIPTSPFRTTRVDETWAATSNVARDGERAPKRSLPTRRRRNREDLIVFVTGETWAGCQRIPFTPVFRAPIPTIPNSPSPRGFSKKCT